MATRRQFLGSCVVVGLGGVGSSRKPRVRPSPDLFANLRAGTGLLPKPGNTWVTWNGAQVFGIEKLAIPRLRPGPPGCSQIVRMTVVAGKWCSLPLEAMRRMSEGRVWVECVQESPVELTRWIVWACIPVVFEQNARVRSVLAASQSLSSSIEITAGDHIWVFSPQPEPPFERFLSFLSEGRTGPIFG